jgi:nucleotide-binding universal stress UspA family protein
MFKNILVGIDLNDEISCRKPLRMAVTLARTFASQLHVVTVVREVEAVLQAKAASLGYDPVIRYLENELKSLIRQVDAYNLHPKILVTVGATIYTEILAVAESVQADLIVVGSHRPAMKDYLLGTNASRVVRHARCSVLVAREDNQLSREDQGGRVR